MDTGKKQELVEYSAKEQAHKHSPKHSAMNGQAQVLQDC
jgi:uncharacterized membrane protein